VKITNEAIDRVLAKWNVCFTLNEDDIGILVQALREERERVRDLEAKISVAVEVLTAISWKTGDADVERVIDEALAKLRGEKSE
jgi:hypothetical protein